MSEIIPEGSSGKHEAGQHPVEQSGQVTESERPREDKQLAYRGTRHALLALGQCQSQGGITAHSTSAPGMRHQAITDSTRLSHRYCTSIHTA